MQQNFNEKQQTKKNVKRVLLTCLCTIPLLFIVGLLLGEKVNRGLRILIFVLILLIVVGLVEFLNSKKSKKIENKSREDVFK